MTTERWRQIEKIFETVSAAPPVRRPALLEEACAGDPELREEVESLLACDADDEAFLSHRVEGAAGRIAREQNIAMIGKRIGAWRITGVIGHGGMGAVYRAVRDDGHYDKEAALKLVRRGLASEADLRRFRQERQILARLEHPNIARLVDGGTTEDGLPYLVMEYVEGQSITDYWRERSLPAADRLRLFRQVCGAVQYAHQNLVVHRDLKPANILVTPDGTPKLLDFGIAKLLKPDTPTDDIAPTLTTAWLLTPDYASPEQIRGEIITAASDIYSLGAILYEFLTGRRPHRIEGRSAVEIERVVCDQETQWPSTVDGCHHLRGDLDNIVLMAMSKEPSRRYGSVEQFSEDVRRHLEGLPVRARKDTVLYRAGKFLHRNRWPVAIGSLAAAGLVIATGVAVFQAARAQRQFKAVRDLATTMLIDVNGKIRMLPGSVEARRIIVEKGLQYYDSISREAGRDPELFWELARGYEKIAALQASPDPAEPNLLDFTNGLQSYRRALSFAEASERARGRDQASLLLLCRIHVGIGGLTLPKEAEPHLHETLRLIPILGSGSGKYFGPNAPGPDTADYLRDLALSFLGKGVQDSDPAKALSYFRKISFEALRKPTSILPVDRMGDIEGAWNAVEDYLRFISELQASYPAQDIRKRVMRLTEGLFMIYGADILASPFRMNLRQTDPAASLCRKAMTITEEVLAMGAPDSAAQSGKLAALAVLGAVLSTQDPAAAVKAFEQVLSSDIYPGRGPYSVMTITNARWQISYPLRRIGRHQEGLEQALRSVSEKPIEIEDAYNAVGDAQLDLKRPEAALEYYRKALAVTETFLAEKPKNMYLRAKAAGTYDRLGRYYEKMQDWQSARAWYTKAHGLWANWTQPGGISNPFVVRREREMAQAVARCVLKNH
ncbi:MAG TPA: serine/threonine-protein kinase [Bryobacteraceae bacterium]|nr:serine/threonine-protein kinase [Bryobacteraceae bacterium]